MFSRRMMSVFLPVLVLSLVGLMPASAKAGDRCTPRCCCQSLINVNIDVEDVGNVYINDIYILDYNPVSVGDVLSDFEINLLNVLIQHSPIASFNQVELNDWFREFNVLSENQTVVGLINGVVYYLDNH